MSSTLGQPGFVASNRTAQSGVSQMNIGSLGSGVLQTIEESPGAQLADVLYYDKSTGYYNLPSMQRSHGDDYKTCNITSFGSRGTVTLPRKYFNFGPSPIRFRLPIDYCWSGCEYVSNIYNSGLPFDAQLIGKGIQDGIEDNQDPTSDPTYFDSVDPELNGREDTIRTYNMAHIANGGKYHFESPGCSTTLPSSFQSGGLAFAFPQQIELDMGGAGLFTFDRYSNWAAIMASCPFKQQREDLMRMAGGGLCLDTEEESRTMPVVWGLKPVFSSTGTTNGEVPKTVYTVPSAATNGELGDLFSVVNNGADLSSYLPVMWDVLLPIKTPDTNFMYSLERRKPLDTSCFASDFKMTFSWSNFNEWSDTGKGYPNAPVYAPQTGDMVKSLNGTYGGPMDLFSSDASEIYEGDIGKLWPFTGVTPTCYRSENIRQLTSASQADLISEIGAPLFVNIQTGWINNAACIDATELRQSGKILSSCLKLNPCVWTNHYRVASGAALATNVHLRDGSKLSRWNFNNGNVIPNGSQVGVGRCRLPQFACPSQDYTPGTATAKFVSLQRPADIVNSFVSYPTRFDLVEYVNSSLKLTNPALGAYNALRVNKEAVLYYPLQYFYSQIYRVTTNPWKDFKNVSNSSLKTFDTRLKDVSSEMNKITQMIQMPSNPCTSMLCSFFREKDRQTLIQNKLNSYSPVLFWLALNPIKIDLKDGGNTLFSYKNNVDFEMYSMMDRPDALKIPFKGGHVKVQPKNAYGNRYICSTNMNNLYCSEFFRGSIATNLIDAIDRVTYAQNQGGAFVPARIDTHKQSNFWLSDGALVDNLARSHGYRGVCAYNPSADHPEGSVNSYPADHLVDSICIKNGLRVGGGNKSCHTTENYESTIIEFPFVMAEPMTNEKIVQQTPSFARTQLQLDFWIDPFLKPDNGFDDMYDVTYGLTRAVPSGVPAVRVDQSRGGWENCMIGSGPISHPVPDCLHEGGSGVFSSNLRQRDQLGALQNVPNKYQPVGSGVRTLLDGSGRWADGYEFAQSSSWNINNGNLMIHIVFCQNQVWTISPLRTSLLQARG